jgi:hypothetical protein
MSKDLRKARADLKMRWLAANRRALILRHKMQEAEQEATALQRALDTLETAAADMPEEEPEPAPSGGGRRRGSAGVDRIVELLKSRGPLTAPQVASELGDSYWSTITRLKRGPFEVAGTVKSGRRTVQVWSVAGGEAAGGEVPAAAAGTGGGGNGAN